VKRWCSDTRNPSAQVETYERFWWKTKAAGKPQSPSCPLAILLLWQCCVGSIFPLFLQSQETNEKTFINAVRANGALQLSLCAGRKTFYLSESSWHLRLKQRMLRWVLCWQVFHRASFSLWPWLYWKSLLPFNIFILGFSQTVHTHHSHHTSSCLTKDNNCCCFICAQDYLDVLFNWV